MITNNQTEAKVNTSSEDQHRELSKIIKVQCRSEVTFSFIQTDSSLKSLS